MSLENCKRNDGVFCPNCGVMAMEDDCSPLETTETSGVLSEHVQCDNCGTAWRNLFTLVDVEIIKQHDAV